MSKLEDSGPSQSKRADKRPLISVIVTVRNRPMYTEECLERLAQQEMPKDLYEVVVVDDASDDGKTPEMLVRKIDELKRRGYSARLYLLQQHGGPGKARNFGNRWARGDIIVVQDSDDVSLSGRLSIIARWFETHHDRDLFWSGAHLVDRNLRHQHYQHARPTQWDYLERQQDIWHPTMAYRRKILTCCCGLIEYSEDMADVDYGFLLAAKKAGIKYGCYDQALILYRQHSRQISRAQHGLQQKLAREKRKAW